MSTFDLTWNGKTYTSVQGEYVYSLNGYGDLVYNEFENNSTEFVVMKDGRVEIMSKDKYCRDIVPLRQERVANEHRMELARWLAIRSLWDKTV